MTGPAVTIGALVELQADAHGFIDAHDAHEACRAVDAAHGPALVLVHGPLLAPPAASAEAIRIVGAALWDAASIAVHGNGPHVAEVAAAEERAFRTGTAA
ncbi:hypothetical protein [Thermomonospora cellulosilytica]|uniref:Uncharacterized protein n=1 Tax=Thermomonospora cellulosilytica TaxID=1411118 RepID=A0A7W3MUB6_9ACTN|nr:hypothetical protein [Thermomonospora cellulosilytica]MBA9002035.1 hypothetical protein [Thermomonospora cellulosilytica]